MNGPAHNSNQDPSGDNPVREQLVAYLDGELDADEAFAVQGQIDTDPTLREEMNRMEMVWGMLDKLPRAEVDDDFTHSTMAMVALSQHQEVRLEQDLLPRRRRRRVAFGLTGMFAAGMAGFLLVNRVWPDPNQQLLQDLPVLRNMEEYRQVDDLDFLRQLKQENLFPEDPSHGVLKGSQLIATRLQAAALRAMHA